MSRVTTSTTRPYIPRMRHLLLESLECRVLLSADGCAAGIVRSSIGDSLTGLVLDQLSFGLNRGWSPRNQFQGSSSGPDGSIQHWNSKNTRQFDFWWRVEQELELGFHDGPDAQADLEQIPEGESESSNQPPVAVDDFYESVGNSVMFVAAPGLLHNDYDNDDHMNGLFVLGGLQWSSLGAHVAIESDGSFMFDPSSVAEIRALTEGQFLEDTFFYRIEDDLGALSNLATVTIRVHGFNDPPVAEDDEFRVGPHGTWKLDVLANDHAVDWPIDSSSIQITKFPTFGTVEVHADGYLEYTAFSNFRGLDIVFYTVEDTQRNVSYPAWVDIFVVDPPVANDDLSYTFRNTSVDIHVLGNDQRGDEWLDDSSVQIAQYPNSGSVEVRQNGAILFIPEANMTGDVVFSYTVADYFGVRSLPAEVVVRVSSRWQNRLNQLDVNSDGRVSASDVLLIINYLNSGRTRYLPDTEASTPPYLDVNGDERVSALDALLVINELNRRSSDNDSGGNGNDGSEGESDEPTWNDLSRWSTTDATGSPTSDLLPPQQPLAKGGGDVRRRSENKQADLWQQRLNFLLVSELLPDRDSNHFANVWNAIDVPTFRDSAGNSSATPAGSVLIADSHEKMLDAALIQLLDSDVL